MAGQAKIKNAPTWWKNIQKNEIARTILDALIRNSISVGFDFVGHTIKSKCSKSKTEKKKSIFWESFKSEAGDQAGYAVINGLVWLVKNGGKKFWKWWGKADPKTKKAFLKKVLEGAMKIIFRK